MRKYTLFEIMLANIGGLFLAMGLFMVFVSDWNLRIAGVVATVFGIGNLIILIFVRKKYDTLKIENWKSMLARVIMIIAALAIGSGMSQIIAKKNMVFGLIIWVAGLIFSTLSCPILEYIKRDKEKIARTILGTVGCILLLVGMCMTFIGYWNLIYSGTIVGLVGVVFVIVFVFLNKKENEEFYYINVKFIFFVIVEILGAFLTVFGIVKVGSTEITTNNYHNILIAGLLSCAGGFIISALSVPLYIYRKTNNPEYKGLKIGLKSKENDYKFS